MACGTMTYTGEDWPNEPYQEQREGLQDGHYCVLLAGEWYDVDAIHTIVTTLSFLRKYGRPFNNLYKLVRHRGSSASSVVRWEVPFKHQIFTLNSNRVAVLRLLLDVCGEATLYEISHKENGALVSEKNFPDYAPGQLNATLETELRARGWVEPTGKPFFSTIEQWKERKAQGRKAPVLSLHRFFNELSHIWKGEQ
jgi:hypothetical protein